MRVASRDGEVPLSLYWPYFSIAGAHARLSFGASERCGKLSPSVQPLGCGCQMSCEVYNLLVVVVGTADGNFGRAEISRTGATTTKRLGVRNAALVRMSVSGTMVG